MGIEPVIFDSQDRLNDLWRNLRQGNPFAHLA